MSLRKNNPLFRCRCLYSISQRLHYTAVFIVVTLCGCFTPSLPPPVEIPIDSELKDIAATQIDGSPLLYRITIPQVNMPVFGTALEGCGIEDFVPSKATTRQLLVGFSNIKVINQTLLPASKGTVLESVITATVDNEPIHLITFTKRSESCVKDFAFWYRMTDGTASESGVIQKTLRTQFTTESRE